MGRREEEGERKGLSNETEREREIWGGRRLKMFLDGKGQFGQ